MKGCQHTKYWSFHSNESLSKSSSIAQKLHQSVETSVLIEFIESCPSTSTSSVAKPMNVGDVVIQRGELTKWKLGVVTELLTGRDNVARAAVVKMVNSE